MQRTAKLVILTGKVENASDYCKLGVQVRLSISGGVQVERGRRANDARRILHQSEATSRQFSPNRCARRTAARRSEKTIV